MVIHMEMLVSGIFGQGDNRRACVCFQEGNNTAEGTVPDCKITKNNGFSDDEVAQLEQYMRDNIYEIKAEAAQVNPIKAMMKE